MIRRGFALAAVLFALVLLAALTAAGLFAALQEARAGRNASEQLRAQTAAMSAITEAMTGWDASMNTLAVGATAPLAVTAVPGVAVSGLARRLAPRFFLLRADAIAGNAARSVAAVVRLRGLEIQPRVAARARSVDAAILPELRGADAPPPTWSCPATSDTVQSLSLQSGDSDSILFSFGDRDWASLVGWAASAPPGGDSIGVRYEPGDFVLTGGRSLGVLIVAGNLTLSAGAELVGIVVVRGSLVLQGSGGTVVGALVASGIVAGPGFSPGRPVVQYSSCAVDAAGLSRAWPEPLPGQFAVTFF